MKSEVEKAIKEIEDTYGKEHVEVQPDSDGGAYIVVSNIDLGNKFMPSTIWCGFLINHMYPISDVYPHFINPDFQYSGDLGKPKGSFQFDKIWNERKAVQVSRRSKRWNPSQDTALLKLEKVIKFIKES